MARVRRYKRIENVFVHKIKTIAYAFWSGIAGGILLFFRTGTKKLTVMIVPHSQKKVLSFRTSIFSIFFVVLLLLGMSVTFFRFLRTTSAAEKRAVVLQQEAEQAQASLHQIQKETAELVKNGKKFQEALSATITALGLQDTVTPSSQSSTSGDLSEILGVQSTHQGINTSEARLLASYLQNSIDTVEEMGRLLESQTALFSDIPSMWPVKNGIGFLTFPFGQNIHPINGQWYIHKGIDISTRRSGDPIIATADGQVVTVDFDPGWGNYVIIKHKHGFYTRYAHLQSYRATRGQHVQQGQVIGYIGNTGLSTGPHLHYEVHIGSDVVDPLKYLNIKSRGKNK